MEKIKLPVSFSDDRGSIIDMIENETINAITKVTFKAGAVRGNHFHEKTIQWNYLVSGKIRLLTQLPDKSIVETIMIRNDFAAIMAGEKHTFEALEDSELLVFTKGPRGGKEYESDTFSLKAPLVKGKEMILA